MRQKHEIRKRNVTLSVQNVYDYDEDVVSARDAESYTDEKMNTPFKDVEIDFGEDYEKFENSVTFVDGVELFPETRYMLLKKEWQRDCEVDTWIKDIGRDYVTVETEYEETGEWETFTAEIEVDEDDEE